MKNFAILLILFLSISLAYCAVQPGTLSTKQRNRIYGKINAERKKHCLKALRHSSGLARQALAQAKASATSLKGVPLGKGWMLTAYASSKNKNFDQIRPAPRFKLIERTFWNCQQDRCSQSAGKCMNIRNALYGKATHIGCAAAKSLKNGRYFFFYVCKLNKAAPKSASRTLLSPGKCTGCAPAPAPAPRPAPAPAPRPAPAPAPRPAPAPAPRPAPAPAPRPAPAPAPGSTPQAEINAWLGEQNRVRGCGGALSWDEGLAKQATSWARHLALNNGCNMQHAGNRNGKGENLYKMSGGSRVENIKAGVNMWCLERKAWNCGSNTCTTGKRIQVPLPGGQSFTWPISSCGHYTQIVWRSTTSSVGCGVVACPNSRYMMGVCRYGDQGNYRGRHPFSVSLANDNGKSQCSCFRN